MCVKCKKKQKKTLFVAEDDFLTRLLSHRHHLQTAAAVRATSVEIVALESHSGLRRCDHRRHVVFCSLSLFFSCLCVTSLDSMYDDVALCVCVCVELYNDNMSSVTNYEVVPSSLPRTLSFTHSKQKHTYIMHNNSSR